MRLAEPLTAEQGLESAGAKADLEPGP